MSSVFGVMIRPDWPLVILRSCYRLDTGVGTQCGAQDREHRQIDDVWTALMKRPLPERDKEFKRAGYFAAETAGRGAMKRLETCTFALPIGRPGRVNGSHACSLQIST